MTIYSWLILALWLALVAVWTIAGLRAKPSATRERAWRREIALRLAIVMFVLAALHLLGVDHPATIVRRYGVNRSPVAGGIGVALCALGVGLAVVARFHLGRNWGLPMSRKERPELVTTGPYAAIRHPIYAGLIVAMAGSAIGQSIGWTMPLILLTPYFIHSARREEALMREQFPDAYPAYMRRTKMLAPWIF